MKPSTKKLIREYGAWLSVYQAWLYAQAEKGAK